MGERRGVLARLARDKRGNTLAIMAASLVPMIGFSGSAIDMGRIYVVKVRLQQACDAGVLATRKSMSDSQLSTALDSNAAVQGQAFFKNNFKAGWYDSSAVSFTPVKATTETGTTNVANAVTGTATATIPMTLMKFFGVKPYKLTVGCQAVYDMADTDVMFVLDTTGSMSCKPTDPTTCANGIASYTRGDGTTGYYNVESSGSKLAALRNAVTVFDSTMRSSSDSTTHFRYGFVTYSSAANVGRSIYDVSPSYLQDDAPYQSRFVTDDYKYGDAVSFTQTGMDKTTCLSARYPAGRAYARTGPSWTDQGYYQAKAYTNASWKSANNGTCTGTQQTLRPVWRYDLTWRDVRQWKLSMLPNATPVVNPSRLDGSGSKWRGCIEELNTTTDATFDVNNLPDDLDPDVKPTDVTNRWRPQWPDAVWNRSYYGYQDVKDEDVNEYGISSNPNWPNNVPLYDRNYGPGRFYDDTGSAACGMPAKRLQVWTAQQVKDYVNDTDFKPFGGTYHDVGMIWGVRMLSPNGIFAADTAAWPGRKDPTRNIVFMTDGTMAPSQFSYGQYGVEIYDNRTGGQGNSTTDYNNHTARFRVECDVAKKKGYTIYVVALGTALTSDLTYCASPGQAFQASSDAALSAYFKTIAQRIAMLRIQK